MFELIFGTFWTLFMVFSTYAFYGTNGDVYVNGTPVSHEEFSAMLGPKLLFGLFWAVGLFMMGKGLIKVIKNILTNQRGEECFGRVDSIYNSGAYVKNRPELKADFLVYIPSTQETKVVSEIIGFNRYNYEIGSYVKLKYYEGDINIEGVIEEFELPSDAKYQFDESPLFDSLDQNTIVINGVEYVRKDSIY